MSTLNKTFHNNQRSYHSFMHEVDIHSYINIFIQLWSHHSFIVKSPFMKMLSKSMHACKKIHALMKPPSTNSKIFIYMWSQFIHVRSHHQFMHEVIVYSWMNIHSCVKEPSIHAWSHYQYICEHYWAFIHVWSHHSLVHELSHHKFMHEAIVHSWMNIHSCVKLLMY